MFGHVPKALQDAVASGAMRSSARSHCERSLLARLELTSYMRSSAQVNASKSAPGGALRAWWFKHGFLGFDTGLMEGLQLPDPALAPAEEQRADWVRDALLRGKARIVATKSLLAPDRQAAAASEPSLGLLETNVTETYTDVLPLGDSYEETLGRLGRHTRRNMRKFRKDTANVGVTFSWHTNPPPFTLPEIAQLAQHNRPAPIPLRRIRKYERYVDTAGRTFRSALKDKDGRMISYCCGFIEGDCAYIVLQLNHQDWHASSPSLVHRGYLMEALGSGDVRTLIFVHGCAGILAHSCVPTLVNVNWAMRSDLVSRVLTTAAIKVLPGVYYQKAVSQMLQNSGPLLGGARQ